MAQKNNHYNVAVIGGGPAGLMAAGMAASRGVRVILIEKKKKPGEKLLITAKGRCNITNAVDDMSGFIEVFGRKGKFLYPALNSFGVDDTIRFFNENGLSTKIERGRRVFPESDKSGDVLNVLLEYLKKSGVTVAGGTTVTEITKKGDSIEKIQSDKGEVCADRYILCTGGLSYPKTGSTGDGYKWAEQLGHTVVTPKPSLVPVETGEPWVRALNGLHLKNVSAGIYHKNKKYDERFGEAYFLSSAVSGPIILDMSAGIERLLREDGHVYLHLDIKPALDHNTLDKRIQKDLNENSNRIFKNSIDRLMPKQLIPVIIELSGIDPRKKCHQVTREERKALTNILKCLKIKISGLGGFNQAIITSGGVDLKEIYSKTMRSKIIENLYFAGEIIDLDGPTGGYNLQVCWSTGHLAGESVCS